ncbi:DUF1059 domain-containing protein [Nocardioides pelophilus]|uniref:DUF1059 domain-containing protein n=1 Tax=Nocardioides pelophilus TaxID=2172019 RepID=UPI001600F235|nr:DUF1059 domain-containing protein [Nocardioides pelophilus]
MTDYAVECQALGFVCDWRMISDDKPAAVAAVVEHVNKAHGTGTTSLALSALVERYVAELPARGPSGRHSHRKEHAS